MVHLYSPGHSMTPIRTETQYVFDWRTKVQMDTDGTMYNRVEIRIDTFANTRLPRTTLKNINIEITKGKNRSRKDVGL